MSDVELFQIEKEIKSQLQPFLDGIRTKPEAYKLFRKAYMHYRKKLDKSRGIFYAIVPQRKIQKPSKMSVKDVAHLMFVYLGLIESLGNCIVEMACMLLIANGRDFHIQRRFGIPRIKHVDSIKDFEKEKVPLGMKLAFLEGNNVTELASVIDTEIRNSVAHLDFDIRKESIYIKGKPAVDLLWNEMKKLDKVIKTTGVLLNKLAEDKGIAEKRNKP